LKPVKKLLRDNHLLSMIRGHEVEQEGYKFHLWEGEKEFPMVMTVFSAPNYCGAYQNFAAIAISNIKSEE
jgi:serine/threonine-protein phosphatase 2B catalytic subunit